MRRDNNKTNDDATAARKSSKGAGMQHAVNSARSSSASVPYTSSCSRCIEDPHADAPPAAANAAAAHKRSSMSNSHPVSSGKSAAPRTLPAQRTHAASPFCSATDNLARFKDRRRPLLPKRSQLGGTQAGLVCSIPKPSQRLLTTTAEGLDRKGHETPAIASLFG